jgi:hypothetical protein
MAVGKDIAPGSLVLLREGTYTLAPGQSQAQVVYLTGNKIGVVLTDEGRDTRGGSCMKILTDNSILFAWSDSNIEKDITST